MARTIVEIQAQIIAAKEADGTLNTALTSTSKVAIWRLWTYVTAVCQWTLETLFDAHKSEVQTIILQQKPHTLQWYVMKAKAFQLGDDLPADSDVYDPISTEPSDLIVVQAAAVELNNLIRIKAAKLSGDDLAALSGPELSSFTAYMQRIKDAGVRLQCTSGAPDNLVVELQVDYDPLVLNASGERIDGTELTPVKDALKLYLRNMPFNGLFVVNKMLDKIRETEGVVNCRAVLVEANYAMTPYVTIVEEYYPDAGYLTIADDDFTVTYEAHAPII